MSTLVIGHRTVPRHAAENSLAGIGEAARQGADLVEVDVRCTRDGVPVLLHDRSLRRTTGRPVPLRWLGSDRAGRLRLRGSAPGSGEPLPTLAAALAVVPEGVGLALDVKDPGAGHATVTAVCAAGMTARVLLWSQHEPAVSCFAREAPEIEASLLRDTFDAASTRRLLDEAVAWGARGVSVHQGVLDGRLIDAAHDRGLAVYCWFQSLAVQEARLAEAARAGLDGVVTDWVAEARQVLGRPSPR